MREHHPELMDTTASSIQPDQLITPDLPLERRGSGDAWYWACSFACGKATTEEMVHWHKRADQTDAETVVDFQGRRGVINTKSGFYKGYRMPLITYLCPKLIWYAVGDPLEIARMCNQITHIGKKRSQGYGRVSEWSVALMDTDLSSLRAIPATEGQPMGIRPPYWLSWQWQLAEISDDQRLAYRNRGDL
jgi:CRISPR type IV-associated protein Csf3